MMKSLALVFICLQVVYGGDVAVGHGDYFPNDPRCPTFNLTNWANPGNYFADEENCHAYRVCDLQCGSTRMCCPITKNRTEEEPAVQMVWDSHACECVPDNKTQCEDDICQGAPAVPYFPRPTATLDGECWRNGILYKANLSGPTHPNGFPLSYNILQPDELPFETDVNIYCPSEPATPGLPNAQYVWQQWFNFDDELCCCMGNTTVNAPEEPRCILMEASDDLVTDILFNNRGNSPRSMALTHRGMQLRPEGYFFSGALGTCFEFPYFKTSPFWYPGFGLYIFFFRGTGILVSNFNDQREGTIEVSVASTATTTTFSAQFDTIASIPDLVFDIPMDSLAYRWSLHIYFCFLRGRFTYYVEAIPTSGEGSTIIRRADAYTDGTEIWLRDCPLAIGCDETSTNNFQGTIGRIEMICADCQVADAGITDTFAGPSL